MSPSFNGIKVGPPSLCFAWPGPRPSARPLWLLLLCLPCLACPLPSPCCRVPFAFAAGPFTQLFWVLTRGTPPEDMAFASQVSNLYVVFVCVCVCVCVYVYAGMCMCVCVLVLYILRALFSLTSICAESVFANNILQHSALYPLILSFSGYLSSFSRASFRPPLPLFC